MIEQGFWNGLPTEIERGTAVVADAPQFPMYWAREEGIVGQRIDVCRVVLDGVNYGGGTTHLDNRRGQGYAKVSSGGSPRYGHASVTIEPGSFVPTVHDAYSDPDAAFDELHADAIEGHRKAVATSADARCPECGGIGGAHGLVHTRYGNGGGGNAPCSHGEERTDRR
jgi:hypothetical protein